MIPTGSKAIRVDGTLDLSDVVRLEYHRISSHSKTDCEEDKRYRSKPQMQSRAHVEVLTHLPQVPSIPKQPR